MRVLEDNKTVKELRLANQASDFEDVNSINTITGPFFNHYTSLIPDVYYDPLRRPVQAALNRSKPSPNHSKSITL